MCRLVGAGGAATGLSWVTVMVRPATVSVPVRDAVDVFADTVYVTVPFPLPLLPLVILTQLRLSVALHAQPLVVVTATLAELPPAAIAGVVGDTV